MGPSLVGEFWLYKTFVCSTMKTEVWQDRTTSTVESWRYVCNVMGCGVCIYVCWFPYETVCESVCACVSYWFNFPLYVAVNECYLNKATEAHKSACVEIVDLVKFLLTSEVQWADGQRQRRGSWREKSSTSSPSAAISLKSDSHRWSYTVWGFWWHHP